MWSFTAWSAAKTLRRLLALLSVEGHGDFLKAFRAGRATSHAAAGKSIGIILSAGEWRSAAFLSYVDTDVVDQAQLLDKVLDESDGH